MKSLEKIVGKWSSKFVNRNVNYYNGLALKNKDTEKSNRIQILKRHIKNVLIQLEIGISRGREERADKRQKSKDFGMKEEIGDICL